MIRIAPSILSADFADLGRELAAVSAAGADWAHVDVMDGVFVPNITVGIPVVKSLRKATELPLDVHLMITNPHRYVGQFADAGAHMVTVHLESETAADISRSLDAIRSHGALAGISIKPETRAEAVFPWLDRVDMVLIMTVEPGFGGQSLIPHTLDKVKTVRAEAERRGLELMVEVDGGVNARTARACTEAGADVLVAGSAVFGAENRAAAIAALRAGV